MNWFHVVSSPCIRRYIRRMHGELTTWNQFMHYKFTFYAPELDSHVLKMMQLQKSYMLRKYRNGGGKVRVPSAPLGFLLRTAGIDAIDLFSLRADDGGSALHALLRSHCFQVQAG